MLSDLDLYLKIFKYLINMKYTKATWGCENINPKIKIRLKN